MTLIEESQVQSLLTQCQELSQRQEREAREALAKKIDQVYHIFKRNVREAFSKFSLDVLVRFTELSVENPTSFEKGAQLCELLFERVSTTNQFYIRALLVKAKVVAYSAHSKNEKGEEMMNSLKEALIYISKALDLIAPQQEAGNKGKDPKGQSSEGTNKSRYAFLIYNASTTLYKVTRFMLRPGWQKNFAEIYQRLYKLMDDVDEPDHNWRSRFAMVLYQCLYDADKKPDAFKILDTLWERTKNKPCDFQDSLFRLRCYLSKENAALAGVIKKDIEGADPNGWKILEPLQRMRSGLVPEQQIQKQLMAIVNQISLGVLSNNENASQPQLSPIMQQRLAEAGRVALRFNLVSLTSSIVAFLSKTRNLSQRALILNEYNKGELLIKKKGQFIDKNTGMTMTAGQIKEIEIENRKEALRIMEKVMLINKKVNNAELIYEGCIIIWNMSLPFLTPQYHAFASKALDMSLGLIEQIDSNDHELRTKLHLQLINIYFGNEVMFSEVQRNVFKALRLDPSIPSSKLSVKPEGEEDPSLYTRPYHRYLQDFRQRVLLKTMQVLEPSPLDIVTQDLWTIQDHKSQTTKIDTLQKCLKVLLSYEYPQFQVDPSEMLVEEEIKAKKLQHEHQKLRALKRTKLLAAEIAKLSFEWDLNDFAKKASEFVLGDSWEVKNSIELVIAQGHCSLFMAQIKIDELYQSKVEPLFEVEENQELTAEQKAEIKQKKDEVLKYLGKTLTYAQATSQSYLTFNGAICLWNNFLHIFRVNANDSKLRGELTNLMKDYFEAMKNILREMQSKAIVYYDLDDRIQTFSNIGLVYARLLQGQKQVPLVEKVCEDLLLTNLAPNTRKIVNGMKARVSGGKAPTGAKPDAKKGASQPQRTVGFNDTFLLEINNQLETIQNTQNKAQLESQIIKCFEVLDEWKPNEQDECQLQLHAQLLVKLARLASNEQANSKLLKYSLRCCQKVLIQCRAMSIQVIPSNRLRWYSLAQFLSSRALLKLVNPKTQEPESMEVLLFMALNRAVEAAAKGFKCNINILVVDASKQLWNVCSVLQQNKLHRQKLLKPIGEILSFLKEMKEDSEPDLLLVLSQLYFRVAWENSNYREGEMVADMMLDILPKGLQRPIWQAKMGFMSKQGKNELQAISSIKEAEPSLQAKLWVKLARIAPNVSKQQAAYSKALEILKKERSVEIVEVLIQYSEWQLRVGKEPLELVIRNLEYASNVLIEIEYDQEAEDDFGDDDQMTLNSHSRSRSRTSKKSGVSRSIKSSQKESKKDKKVAVSSKSKPSTVSRMNRSGRGQKTVNKNNAKSVFSVKEEDPNPEALNCIHFERLFRIFTILASISPETSKSMSYALMACQQVVNMLKKSIATFNELQVNAAKLNEKEESSKLRIEKVPESIDQWINYEFPKQYIEKIDKIDNNNFLGLTTLEKPELTYCYAQKLMALMTSLGLDYETLPLSFFGIYFTRFILKNNNYELLEKVKMKAVLTRSKHPLEGTVKVDFSELRITEEEKNEEMSHVKSQKVSQNNEDNVLDVSVAPNLVPPLSNFRYWYLVGSALIEFGEVSTAKSYLGEAMKCAKVVNDSEFLGKIYIGLSECAYLEGELDQAMKNVSLAHRLCKEVTDWQAIVVLASKIMLSIKKYESLKSFLGKVMATTSELIDEASREGKKGSSFKMELSDMKQLLLSVHISMLSVAFRNVLQENTKENQRILTHQMDSLTSFAKENATLLWNISNYESVIQIFKQILNIFESKGGKTSLHFNISLFHQMVSVLDLLQHNNKDFVVTVNLTQPKGGDYNTIIHNQNKVGLLIISCLCYKHSLQNTLEGHFSPEDEHESEIVKGFLKTVNKEIAQHKQPVATELSPIERGLAIINEIEGHIAEKSSEWGQLSALKLFLGMLAREKDEQQIEQFKVEYEARLNSFQQNQECFYYQSKAYEALTQFYQESQDIKDKPQQEEEASVQKNHAQVFEYLSKYQQANSAESTLTFLKKKLTSRHKVLSTLRLMQKRASGKARGKMIQGEKTFGSLLKQMTYDECLKLLPKNSLSIMVQFNKLRSKVYFSMVHCDSDPTQKQYYSKSKDLSESQLRTYLEMQAVLVEYQKYLTKTSFEDDKKIDHFMNENEQKLKQIRNNMEALNSWWLRNVIDILRTPKNVPNAATDKDKKGGKDQKKKGGKDQLAPYQSPLPPSPSGIESVVFFLDDFLHSLPFEELIPTELISTVSKDNSLFWHSRKLQQMNFQPQLNNSNNFGSDKGKYFSYSFKNDEYNLQEILSQAQLDPTSIKLEGIEAKTKVPSFGDYIDTFAKPGFLTIYGCVDFINLIRFNALLQFVGQTKLKLLIVTDNLNFPKSLLLKHKDINQEYPSIALEDQEQALSIISNLLGSTVVKNRWMPLPNRTGGYLKDLYTTLGKSNYIGSLVRQIRKQSDRIGENWTSYIHGPGILRL